MFLSVFRSADFDRQVDALLSQLTSVSGLSAINLSVPFLTETWASRILFLVKSCTKLAVIKWVISFVRVPLVCVHLYLQCTLYTSHYMTTVVIIVQTILHFIKIKMAIEIIFNVNRSWKCVRIMKNCHAFLNKKKQQLYFTNKLESFFVFFV